MKKLLTILTIILFSASLSFAQDVKKKDDKKQDVKNTSTELNEDELFGKEDTVKAKETIVDDQLNKTVDKNSVSFNGFLNARAMYDMSANWLSGNADNFKYNTFAPYIQGNFAVDARLTGGFKGYVNVSANYYPSGTTQTLQLQSYNPATMQLGASQLYSQNTNATFGINEMFVDFNIAKSVYFRFGKQNLVWGTGLLWVPTDLINVDRKNILDPSQVRQGSYGMKMTIPFGTRANIYTYVKLDNVTNFDQLTFAAKFELLLGTTELAISTVLNQYKIPVYGFNFTTRILTIDFRGEVSLGDNNLKLDLDSLTKVNTSLPTNNNLNPYIQNIQLIPKVSAGFGRSFEMFNIANNFRFDVEFFYNAAGYDNNSLVLGKNIVMPAANPAGKQNVLIDQMFASSLYTPNYYGMYYLGIFLSLAQAGTSDLSMGLNYIINLSDYSSVISYSINYLLHYNLTLTILINAFLGDSNTEYTTYFNTANLSAKKGMNAELMVKLNF